ncbi:pyruvate formate-lyase-activating protein [Paraclostridium bifermentans]|uniref:pyruvate formate-lyase-activating protein n=1 Tax=Paraclostridium bifermentans TaxID=1490 RepID=UPI000A16EEEC|nr:pyruvate formate-lyase-activating protein [Paraclostridium bifermentans]OSB09432.1 pyruvate formate-lyase 1-activating enzyme [Paraclostridium bifermentans]
MVKGRVHSIETFGTVDGPGIRFILFMQGCPLRCKYCHNRDTWDVKGGTEYTTDEIIEQVKKYSSYMKFSGGGLTVSGGEATLQPEFLKDLFKKAQENEIHTCLDTSGFINIDVIDPVLDYTNLVLLDLKHMVPEKCKDLVGVSIDKTLEFAKHLSDRNIPVWIRHVLVPGITDDRENLELMGKFISTLKNIDRVELLPYHTLGVHKWENMGFEYELKDVPDATSEDIEKASKILAEFGVITHNK